MYKRCFVKYNKSCLKGLKLSALVLKENYFLNIFHYLILITGMSAKEWSAPLTHSKFQRQKYKLITVDQNIKICDFEFFAYVQVKPAEKFTLRH